MRCFIDITMAQSVGRSWSAATISTKNSKTKAYSGILRTAEHLSCCLENLQELNHIRNRLISILRRCTFYQTIEGVQGTAQQVAD